MTLDRINYLNIGLMLVSLVLAFILPFELFLFSYAVLGPAHYLTEISWLHDRQYFAKKKFDFLPLVAISLAIFMGTSFVGSLQIKIIGDLYQDLLLLAFGIGFLVFVLKDWTYRIFGLMILLAFMLLIRGEDGKNLEGFGVFIPTLIHVYVFTGAFILFGSLKSRSTSGYLSMLVFILCPIACFVLLTNPTYYHASSWATGYYSETFINLSLRIMETFTGVPRGLSMQNFFSNPLSVMIARFIAFAYTYHYLNWFSKTSVIKWHEVSKLRIAAVVILWIGSVALYMKDYLLGFKWLFFLSFAHVLLEFPLNHHSFIGIGKEIMDRLSPPKGGKVAAKK